MERKEPCSGLAVPPVASFFPPRIYVDTIVIWLARKPANLEFAELKQACGRMRMRQYRMKWDDRYHARLKLDRPTRKVILALMRIAKRSSLQPLVSELHIALDIEAADKEAIRSLRRFIELHLVKKWHGKHKATYYRGTYYSRKKKWPSLVLTRYSDKPSRFTDRPCLHIELRAFGASMVRRLRVRIPEGLTTANLRSVLKRHICLEQADKRLLGKQFFGRGRAKKEISINYGQGLGYPDKYRRAGELIVRAAARREANASAYEIRKFAKRRIPGFHPETAMKKLPIELLLEGGIDDYM